MTSRRLRAPERHHARGGVASNAPVANPDRPIRRGALAAGIGLLLMIPLSGFGVFVVVEGLVTPDDAAQTATDIMGSVGLFRAGVASLITVIVLDIVVAWGLYGVLAPADRGLSLLAGWLRIVYSGVFLVAISRLVGVPRLLNGDDSQAAFSVEQLQAQALLEVDTFGDIWSAGLLLFGLHLVVVGWLAFRADYVPTLLGVLVGIAGIGYAFDGLAAVLAPGSFPELAPLVAIGEVLLAVWLVVRGRKLTLRAPGHDPARTRPQAT